MWCNSTFINTPDSFAIHIGRERFTWGCLNGTVDSDQLEPFITGWFRISMCGFAHNLVLRGDRSPCAISANWYEDALRTQMYLIKMHHTYRAWRQKQICFYRVSYLITPLSLYKLGPWLETYLKCRVSIFTLTCLKTVRFSNYFVKKIVSHF